MHKSMDFTGWNHIEIMAYIFQANEIGRLEVIKLVQKRLGNENS